MKHLLPSSVKLHIRKTQRVLRDIKNGTAAKFAKPCKSAADFAHTLSQTQPILNATTRQSKLNKIHNIKIAIERIEAFEIQPGEIFSYWHAIGRPSKRNGFKEGINIIRGKVKEDFGGGLCQLSSIIFHTSMRAGLKPVERHNHSVDLYHNQERYVPLGADAAVFYGYKDLRIENTLDTPIRFRFEIMGEDELICHILSPESLPEYTLSFDTQDNLDVTTKRTNQEGQEDIIAHSLYKRG